VPDLKPYPAYKDSGAAWLGSVPEHWKVLPNRALFLEVNERDHPVEAMLSVTITRGVARQSELLEDSSMKDSSREDKSAYKLVRPGDVAYNKMRAWQGAIGVSKHRGIVSPAYVVQRLRTGHLPRYYHHLLRTPAFASEAERWSYGITSDMWSLRPEHFKLIRLCAPPLEEQEAIVRFLDHLDRRTRRYIKAKQKLIKLLEEQKQAVVQHEVTGGIDQAVVHTRAVEGLRSVPEHWDIPLLGRCLRRIEQGWSPVAAEGRLDTDQWAVLTLSAVRRGSFDPRAIKPVARDANVPSGIELGDGDLLLTRSNTRDRVGDVCLVEGVRPKTIFSDLIYRLRVDSSALDSHFLMLQLLSRWGRAQIERDARGSSGTMPKISQRHIRSWRVMLPPLNEQVQVVLRVRQECAAIQGLIQRAVGEAQLAREHHTRLISDVVSGKLDVREAAANLPDETDEARPLADEDLLADESEYAEEEQEAALEEVEA